MHNTYTLTLVPVQLLKTELFVGVLTLLCEPEEHLSFSSFFRPHTGVQLKKFECYRG